MFTVQVSVIVGDDGMGQPIREWQDMSPANGPPYLFATLAEAKRAYNMVVNGSPELHQYFRIVEKT